MVLQGINWFGFNNGQTMVDGLWAGYQAASTGDFPTVLKRIKLLGFNGLRLPFTFQDLDRAPSTSMYVAHCRVSEAAICTYYVELTGWPSGCGVVCIAMAAWLAEAAGLIMPALMVCLHGPSLLLCRLTASVRSASP